MQLLAHRGPLPALAEAFSARPPASAFLLPPFPRNLSQVRLHPDASLGGETPDRFPASPLPRSLGSQTPLFFAWTGSHGLLSPSLSSGFLPLPLVYSPLSPQSLCSAQGPSLPSSFSLPGVQLVLSLPLS